MVRHSVRNALAMAGPLMLTCVAFMEAEDLLSRDLANLQLVATGAKQMTHS